MKLSELKSMLNALEQEQGPDIEVFIFNFYRGPEAIDGCGVHKAKSNIYEPGSRKCMVKKGKTYLVLG